MKKILTELLILIGIGGLLWAAFAFFIKMPEKPEIISPELEQILGEKYKDAILSLNGFTKIETSGIDSILSLDSEKLSDHFGSSRYNFKITLVRNDMVNAFALPAGNIIITTGLVNFCESSDELFAVLSHEAGHIADRHIISRLVKNLGITILTSDNKSVTGEIAKRVISTGYDRKQEEEADHSACEILEKAGVEPYILASFFRRLKEVSGQEIFSKFEILFSHPNLDKRIRNVLSYNTGSDFKSFENKPDIQVLKNMIQD